MIGGELGEFLSSLENRRCWGVENGQVFVKSRGYNLDIDAFIKFLEEGAANYKK